MISRIFSAFANTDKTLVIALWLLFPAAPALAADAASLASLPVNDRIKSCNPSIAIPAALGILNNPANLKEPLTLFAPVQTLYQHGQKDEAVFWYYAVQLRTRYQLVFEKGDRGQLLMVMSMTTGQLINNYALQDTTRFTQTLDRVLEWDQKTVNPYRDKPQTEANKNEITKIYDGMRELKAKVSADKEKYETQARKNALQIEQAYTGAFKTQCQSGQLDPALVDQETKKEWAKAIQFAKSNPDVIRAAGKIIEAYPASSTRNGNGEIMPNKYEISLKAENGKSVYAIIDVTRTAGQANFSLACTTGLSLGQRDPRKNACAQ